MRGGQSKRERLVSINMTQCVLPETGSKNQTCVRIRLKGACENVYRTFHAKCTVLKEAMIRCIRFGNVLRDYVSTGYPLKLPSGKRLVANSG